MSKRLMDLTCTALMVLCAVANARAQAPAAKKDTAAAQQGKAGAAVEARYAVPEIPATTFLNAASANITRPITPKDLLLALVNGVNDQGRAQQGFAIEVSPYAVAPRLGATLAQYRRSPVARIASNLLGSLAATAADSTATDLAYGLRATLLDAGDPMRDSTFRVAVDLANRHCQPASPPPNVPRPGEPGGVPRPGAPPGQDSLLQALIAQAQKTTVACMDRATDSLAAAYARKHWNAGRLVLAWAGGQRVHGTSLRNTSLIGNRAWLVGGVPVGRVAQGIAYLDYSTRRSADTLPLVKAITYGARANLGSDALNAFVELLGQSRSKPPKGVQGSSTAWSGGLEVRAGDGLWLSAGLGKRFQDAVKPDRVAVLANVRWGMSSRPWLRPGT